MTIGEAGDAIRRGEITSERLVGQCLARIALRNPEWNAFLTVTAESALETARARDRELQEGRDRGALHGIPIAHKDLISTKGVRTTCGSPLFAGQVPDRDAAVVERLEAAGAVSLGKTGLHELAYGVTSENPHFGFVRNPRDASRMAGGSSGGSGAAVADGMVSLATGTDTGGSIRIPASFCGVVGLKPTYGLVSCYGIQPLAASLDHAGPIAGTVADVAIGLEAMAGYDARDPNSVRRAPRKYWPPEDPSLEGVRVGLPENFYFDGVDAEIVAAVRRAADAAARKGARVHFVRMPNIESLNAAGLTILLAEAAAVYRGRMQEREKFGTDVLELLEQGLTVSAADYLEAIETRRKFKLEFAELFERIDCLFTPTTSTAAPRLGEKEIAIGGQAVNVRLASTRLARGWNVVGLPALAMPCGRSSAGLPLSLQISAGAFREDLAIRAGAAVGKAAG